jgi:CRISPR-associated endoribonuclease Cas6
MSASEIITYHGSASQTRVADVFEVLPLRFQATSRGKAWTPNLLRGAFGSTLKKLDEAAYAQFFTPSVERLPTMARLRAAPSGLRNLPRPFVFRVSETSVGVNLFLASAVELVCRVMRELELELCAQPELAQLPLVASANSRCEKLRVRFLTPTELKGCETPEFGPLLARIRDRMSTLRALYGDGPLQLDFREFGERASAVRMTKCELEVVEQHRVSRGTGQRHSLGGFVGLAEYEGAIAEFLPYLEAARWTGVGRQTVWGKGEVDVEVLHA